MTKSELLEYLERVRKAEAAVFACDEALHALEMRQASVEQSMENIVWPYKPEEIPEQPEKSQFVDNPSMSVIERAGCLVKPETGPLFYESGVLFKLICGYFMGGILAGICAGLVGALGGVGTVAFFAVAVCGMAAGMAVPFILGKRADQKHACEVERLSREKYMQRKREVEKRIQEEFERKRDEYDLASAMYRTQYDSSHRSWHIYQKAKERIEQDREVLQKINNTLVERRREIYNEGVLYETFWNIVAVNQIRDYLRMGLCETLEGPTGAYAQYMQDVRAERICGTVRSLKDAMERGMGQILSMQVSLVEAVNAVGEAVENLDISLSGSIGRMSESIQNAQKESLVQLQAIKQSNDQTHWRLYESAERANAYFAQANFQLEQLNQGVATSNFMQYLDLYGMVQK